MLHPSLMLGILAATSPALAWNADGHRTITLLALDTLPADAPEWLRDEQVRAMIAEQSTSPDKWRGLRDPTLNHENNPDHYIDLEDLAGFSLSLDTLPRFRYEYLRVMAVQKHEHPEQAPAYDATKDTDFTREWPGYLPYSIAEHYAKLRSEMNTYRILAEITNPSLTEGVGGAPLDPERAAKYATAMEAARQNITYEMGILSHFVGDAAQPLHTTIHHHGWIGDNPKGYTTAYGFHAYIDGTILEIHGLDAPSLREGKGGGLTEPAATPSAGATPGPSTNPPPGPLPQGGGDSWPPILAHIQRSFESVEPLYSLEKSGDLTRNPGKAFIANRLRDGASTLGALYRAAWDAAAPTDEQVAGYLRYN